jgi:SAM-dependent methyltransferase
MSLQFTGERFLTECQGEMVYEHWHRYLLAREYAKGKRVLDAPSGEGYGAHLMASVAESVVGIDIADEAIAHATAKYTQKNLKYIAASGTKLPFPDASFDLVVSFEMIEHIHEQAEFLDEVNRVLAPDGLFIISSPNRPEYSDKTGYKNEFHVKELDKTELHKLLRPRWPHSLWLAQRAAFHSMIWPIDVDAIETRALDVEGKSAFPEPMYFVVFCGKSEAALAQVRASLTLVTDKENSVYAEWSRTYRENRELRAEVNALRQAQSASSASTTSNSPTSNAANESLLVRIARKLTG